MDKTAEDLKVRTKRFAIAVLEFVDTLPDTPGAAVVAKQLARAATGVAGNYRRACRARSHHEFTARIGLVNDESDESELWIDVAEKRGWGAASKRASLLTESGELQAIFSKAYRTAKARDR